MRVTAACGHTLSHVSLIPRSSKQPVYLHGSLGREAATGRGTVFAIRELLRAMKLGTIKDKTFVIQASANHIRQVWKDRLWVVLCMAPVALI